MDANVFVHSALINNGSLLPCDMICAHISSCCCTVPRPRAEASGYQETDLVA